MRHDYETIRIGNYYNVVFTRKLMYDYSKHLNEKKNKKVYFYVKV